MNMKIQGIQLKIIAWVLSVGVGFSFCCSHIETPSRIGQTPIEMIPSRLVGPGAPQGSRPKRLIQLVGSGAERSRIQPKNGAWRSSIVTKITL
jgi:hypothetical protein